jgi:hypothetical protein
MNIKTFLSVQSITLGILGSIYLAKGLLWVKAKDIRNMSQTYFNGNSFLGHSFAKQKTDYLRGIILIIISFSIQYIIVLLNEQPINILSFLSGIICSILVLICFVILCFFAGKYYLKNLNSKINKEWND